ncbi:hypothetical protein ACIRJO_25775 [Streptomyces sp. NPDC102394]|uniref:hypothetical protein n=1 Tax=Streptomyces sp. NPDC102394 TaxID=3366167 RepID=UPI0038064898
MPELRCEAFRRLDDEPCPGIVEVQFVDAAGRRWSLIDTCSTFGQSTELSPASVYPVEVTVACDIETTAGDGVVTVSTAPDGVSTSLCTRTSSSPERMMMEPVERDASAAAAFLTAAGVLATSVPSTADCARPALLDGRLLPLKLGIRYPVGRGSGNRERAPMDPDDPQVPPRSAS